MSDAQFDAMLEHPPTCAFWSGDDGAKCTCGRRYLSIKDDGGNHTGYWKDTENGEVVTFDDAD